MGAAGGGSDAVSDGRVVFPFPPSAWLVDQAPQPAGREPSPPQDDHALGYLQSLLDLLVALPLGSQQNDARSQDIPLGGRSRTDDAFQRSFALQKLTLSRVLNTMEWDEKGVREDYVRPHLRRIERRNQFGVYFILKSMELGPSFRSAVPRFPVDNPHYRILARQRSRYTHYYFYIRDEVLGPIALCVGSFLPFSVTYYLNGHHFIERQLERASVPFRKDDNAFLLVADQKALQAAADRLSPQIIRQQLDHWTWVVGPEFSQKDRAAINLSRHYSLQQIEYCRNLVFRRNFPIHKLFERSCDLGLFRHSDGKRILRMAYPPEEKLDRGTRLAGFRCFSASRSSGRRVEGSTLPMRPPC